MSDFAKGDAVRYSGSLGEHQGVVAAVRDLFDEQGATLRAYDVRLDGVGLVRTSGDALTLVEQPAAKSAKRSAKSDG